MFALKALLERARLDAARMPRQTARASTSRRPAAYRFNPTIAGIETRRRDPAGRHQPALGGAAGQHPHPQGGQGGREGVRDRPGGRPDLSGRLSSATISALLGKLPEAVSDAFDGKANAAVIVGMGALAHEGAYAAARAAAAAALGATFNLLHTAACRVGALDIGFATDGGIDAIRGEGRGAQGAVPARRRRGRHRRLRRHLHGLYRHPRRPRRPPRRRHPAGRRLYREARHLRQPRGPGAARRARGRSRRARRARTGRSCARCRTCSARRCRSTTSSQLRAAIARGGAASRHGGPRRRSIALPACKGKAPKVVGRDRLSDRGFLPDQPDRPRRADDAALLGRDAPRPDLPGGGGMRRFRPPRGSGDRTWTPAILPSTGIPLRDDGEPA